MICAENEHTSGTVLQYNCAVCGEDSFAYAYCYNCCPQYCDCGGGYKSECAAREAWLKTTRLTQMYQAPPSVHEKFQQFLNQKSIQALTLDTLSQHHQSFGDCAISFMLDLPKSQCKSNAQVWDARMRRLSITVGALIFTGTATLGTTFGGYRQVEKFLDLSGEEQRRALESIDTLCTVQLHCVLIERTGTRRWALRQGDQYCIVDNRTGLIHLPGDVDFCRIWFKKS